MRNSKVALLGAVALFVSVVPAASTVGAAPSVKIVRVFFDSPGSPDTKTNNTSLNGEYVAVKNMTTKAINLKGWKLADAQAHVYVFPSLSLLPGKTVNVHTGSGTNKATDVYWKSGNFVWNNDTDVANLHQPSGARVHLCKYPNAAGGVKVTGTTATGKYATCP